MVVSMFLCYFARGFHEAEELKTTYFQGKRQEFVGEWMERNNLNLQTECASMIRTQEPITNRLLTYSNPDLFLQKKQRKIFSV